MEIADYGVELKNAVGVAQTAGEISFLDPWVSREIFDVCNRKIAGTPDAQGRVSLDLPARSNGDFFALNWTGNGVAQRLNVPRMQDENADAVHTFELR